MFSAPGSSDVVTFDRDGCEERADDDDDDDDVDDDEDEDDDDDEDVTSGMESLSVAEYVQHPSYETLDYFAPIFAPFRVN